jgi:hypothetical protein
MGCVQLKYILTDAIIIKHTIIKQYTMDMSHNIKYAPNILLLLSARCASAANVVGKDLDLFSTGAVSLNDIYKHQPKSPNIVPTQF